MLRRVVLSAIVCIVFLVAPGANFASEKVEICHQTNGGTKTLSLSAKAASNHLRDHSDDQTGACEELAENQCGFWRETAKNAVKWPPIRMDMNADYLMFAAPSLPHRAFILRGTFPYSAYAAITSYTDAAQGIPYAALNATEWYDDSGSLASNPWQTGNLINSAPDDRQVTLVVTPRAHYATALNLGYKNVLAYAPPISGSERASPMMVFVLRAYLAERYDPNSPDPARPVPFDTFDLFDRRGFVDAPEVYAVDARDLTTPQPCPSLDISLEQAAETVGEAPTDVSFVSSDGQTQSVGNFGNPPQISGRVAFYRIPIPLIQYAGAGSIAANGSEPVEQLESCTGYLSAGLYNWAQINLVGVKSQPTAFDNSTLMPGSSTTFDRGEVLYYSMGSYGPTPLEIGQNAMIPHTTTVHTNGGPLSTVYAVVPESRLDPRSPDQQVIADWASAGGFNVMPMTRTGLNFVPVLIYRNKGTQSDFSGSIREKVACYTTANPDAPPEFRSWSDAPPEFAASPANMGDYAPMGLPCGPLVGPVTQGYLEACLSKLEQLFE